MSVTRRDFIKIFGSSAAMFGAGPFFAHGLLAEETKHNKTLPGTGFGMLIDTSKCVGCKECQIACMKSHDLPVNVEASLLGPTALSIVEMRDISPAKDNSNIQPVKRQCMHCLNPSCVSACTVGALHKRPDGRVVYDTERCIGCRYCMYACPFGVPAFEWGKKLSVMRKCDGCSDRFDKGKITACAEACAYGALVYGSREDILKIAKERIKEGKGKILNHIYGESEIGGTSMVYLAAVPYDSLGFPTLSELAPAEINEKIMHSTPTIAVTILVALSAVHWLVNIRDRLEKKYENENSNKEVK